MNNSPLHKHTTRRHFLKQAGCAALGSTGALSTFFNLQMSNIAAAQSSMDDYKALVCVFLSGGNDSYNMLVPTEASEYANYQYVRGSVALPTSGTDALRPLDALETDGRSFAVHPSLPDVQAMFDAGNVAFIANVGTLVEPTTVAQYQDGAVQLPRALFSHNDQVMQWQTVVPQLTTPTGWAGRMADVLRDPSAPENISMNISLKGNNIWQSGESTSHYTISNEGAVALAAKDWDKAYHGYHLYKMVAGEMDDDETSLVGQAYQNLFEQTYIQDFKNSVDKERFFTDHFQAAGQSLDLSAFESRLTGDDDYDSLLLDLKAVAQTIGVRNELGMQRQVFFVVVDGWDHHDELLDTQHTLLEYLNAGLKAFWDTLGSMGLQDQVFTFTASDFGRTLRTNGRGTDHAWGGHQLVMGGSALCGQRIHGQYPTGGDMGLAEGLDVDKNGRMLPTTSVDEFMSELSLWFGVPYNELETVFPNIRNFYSSTADYLPIGYLKEEMMPASALPTSVPLAVSLKEAEVRARSEQMHMTKSGLIAGTGLAATAAMVALRNRQVDSE